MSIGIFIRLLEKYIIDGRHMKLRAFQKKNYMIFLKNKSSF